MGFASVQTWFLDSPVCLANRCLSASLGYLHTNGTGNHEIESMAQCTLCRRAGQRHIEKDHF
jgi:hypothetical protein